MLERISAGGGGISSTFSNGFNNVYGCEGIFCQQLFSVLGKCSLDSLLKKKNIKKIEKSKKLALLN